MIALFIVHFRNVYSVNEKYDDVFGMFCRIISSLLVGTAHAIYKAFLQMTKKKEGLV